MMILAAIKIYKEVKRSREYYQVRLHQTMTESSTLGKDLGKESVL